MLLNITDISTEPLYNQVSDQLIEKIFNGNLFAGGKLPQARILARKQRVSVKTVERAYKALERNGLITRGAGGDFRVAFLTPEKRESIAQRLILSKISPLGVIETFSQQLKSVFDIERLQNIFIELLKNQLGAEYVCCALCEEKTGKCVLSPDAYNNRYTIDGNDKFLQKVSGLVTPMRVDSLISDSDESPLMQELLSRKVKFVFPLMIDGDLLGFAALSGKNMFENYTIEDGDLLMVLANQFVTALLTARFYAEVTMKRRLEEELKMARQIQASLLPGNLPGDKEVSLAAYSKPSLTVGGDFYDYFPVDKHGLGLVIADASGKGLPAAMMISQIQAMIKSEVNNGNCIQKVVENVNNHLADSSPSERFATLFYGVFNKKTGEFQYANAGHNYPVLVRKDGTRELLKTGGLPLGFIRGVTYKTGTETLSPGDTIFLYTDGVTETMNHMDEEYGEDRLLNVITRTRHYEVNEIISSVINDLNSFHREEPLQDDRTILTLRVNVSTMR